MDDPSTTVITQATPTNDLHTASDPPPSRPPFKQRQKRSFLRSLICCWSRTGRRRSSTTPSSLGGVAGPPGSADGTDAKSQWCSSSSPSHLLPVLTPQFLDKKCIVIDLDETLVHSSFKPISNADFIVPVEIDGTIHQVYVLKRPHVDEFLFRMGEMFECVLFTASLAKYADPVADLLDKWDVFTCRLFRESCVFYQGNYVKDLSLLGRELHKVLIVDNSPASYIFHPDNAIPVASWFDDMHDRELLDLIPYLEKHTKVDSVYTVLQSKKNHSTVVGQNTSNKKKKDSVST